MRGVRMIVLVVPLALVATAAPAMAQPTPAPNPSDEELDASREAVVARAAELGRLSGVVAELDQQAAQVRSALDEQREAAFQRLLELRAADEAAEQAATEVEAARVETAAAGGLRRRSWVPRQG